MLAIQEVWLRNQVELIFQGAELFNVPQAQKINSFRKHCEEIIKKNYVL
jgi:hypothetical protein